MRGNQTKSLLLTEEKIPFLQGRPEREASIDKDDILNLRIALGLYEDVLDLYNDPHLFDFQH